MSTSLSKPRLKPRAASPQNQSFDQAFALFGAKKFAQALAQFQAHEKKFGPSRAVSKNMGLCHFNLDQFAQAAEIFHQLHVDDPGDEQTIHFCAITYMRLGVYDVALPFLKRYVKSHPQDYDTWLNLCHVAGASQMGKEAIFYATQALSLKPLDVRSHINLGAGLLMMDRLDDAQISFETALALEPDNLGGLSNLAAVHEKRGDLKLALGLYERCLGLMANGPLSALNEMKYRMSFALLGTGDLKTGWAYYDHGFEPRDTRTRFPKRKFGVPQWQGEPLGNKRLLIWREQGLGDELRFMGMVSEVLAQGAQVVLEVQDRLVNLVKRSFPEAMVREQIYTVEPHCQSPHSDFDLHIPLASLARILRPTVESFEQSRPYLKPDPIDRAAFEARLVPFAGKRRVGISWRSGVLNAERNKYYTPLSDWECILKIPDVVFVNLQYGDCEAELQAAEQHFGIQIVRWPDLDLKNDLDRVAALTACLDVVVSAPTAVAAMSEAVGVPTKFFYPRSWTLLGQDRWLWYPNVEVFVCEARESVRDKLPEIAQALVRELGACDSPR